MKTLGRRERWLPVAVLASLLPLPAGCAREGERPGGAGAEEISPGARPMSPQSQAFLEEGNTAQREGRYADALERYRAASEAEPGHPVPSFGMLMAAMALGEQALADSLRRELELSSPELMETLGPGGAMGSPHEAPGLPPGHPVLSPDPPDTTRPAPGG